MTVFDSGGPFLAAPQPTGGSTAPASSGGSMGSGINQAPGGGSIAYGNGGTMGSGINQPSQSPNTNVPSMFNPLMQGAPPGNPASYGWGGTQPQPGINYNGGSPTPTMYGSPVGATGIQPIFSPGGSANGFPVNTPTPWNPTMQGTPPMPSNWNPLMGAPGPQQSQFYGGPPTLPQPGMMNGIQPLLNGQPAMQTQGGGQMGSSYSGMSGNVAMNNVTPYLPGPNGTLLPYPGTPSSSASNPSSNPYGVPMSTGAPPWATAWNNGTSLPTFQSQPTAPLPSAQQWQGFTPSEQQAILSTAQSLGIPSQDFLQMLQNSSPEWSQPGLASYQAM